MAAKHDSSSPIPSTADGGGSLWTSWQRAFAPTGNRGDLLFSGTLFLSAFFVLVLIVSMIAVMAYNSRLAFQAFGFGFLISSDWDPVQNKFGALPFIYGTVTSSLIALFIAVPLSLGVAIFLIEQAPRRISRQLAFVIDLLAAAIPSVVYGLWGIFVLAPFLRVYIEPPLQNWFGWMPFFKGPITGIGLLSGGVILTIMITPIITAVASDMLSAVPISQREAALALGATKWETTRVVLANASSGIVGAIILGLGRAIGETMAVTMIIGNRPQISASLFDPSYTIASVIANEFTEATGDLYLSALIEIGLILFLVTFLVNGAARILVWSVSRGTSGTERVG